MEERNPYEETMFEGIGPQVADPNAYTVKEMCEKLGFTDRQVRDLVATKLASGEWERVFKHPADKRTYAYRPTKKD